MRFIIVFVFITLYYFNVKGQEEIIYNGENVYIYPDKIECDYDICFKFPLKLDNGKWIFLFDNQDSLNVAIIGKYQNNKPHGTWLFFYKNGNVKAQLIFKNGCFSGHCVCFFRNSSINYVGEYLYDRNFLDKKKDTNSYNYSYTMIGYYEEGNTSYWTFDAPKTGKWFYFNEQGKVKQEIDFINNTCKNYSKNKLIEEQTFTSDEYYIVNKWNNKGVQIIKNGNGNDTIISKDSSEIYVYYYRKGELFKMEIFSSNKNLIGVEFFNEGKKQGVWRYWNDQGILIKEEEYINDKLIRSTDK